MLRPLIGTGQPRDKKATQHRPLLARKPALRFDVIVVGAGPAGSVLSWVLARRGLKVLLIDRCQFPREKVCGDYVEPRGLRILSKMGCLKTLERRSLLPITHSATYVNYECCYRGKIPFYGLRPDIPPYGYIIPREVLDSVLVDAAVAAGASFLDDTYVRGFTASSRGVEVVAQQKGRDLVFRGRLIVGADGVNSVVARCAGLLTRDTRHISVSQRAYADHFLGKVGEAAFFFDQDLFPGYAWIFPMSRGLVNLGVGILSETCHRESINMPALFNRFVERIRRSHSSCGRIRLCRAPIGGIVKTYGGAGPNYFHSGLLVGDAGSFADPITGEGITPAMESALLASSILESALHPGKPGRRFLANYESVYRGYFDASMLFLDFCAAILRNKHFSEFWLDAASRGCKRAQTDHEFAQTVGACFGGLELHPSRVLSQISLSLAQDVLTIITRPALMGGSRKPLGSLTSLYCDALRCGSSWWGSFFADPVWHLGWTLDVQEKWFRAFRAFSGNFVDNRASSELLSEP